jgi:hypothetical protein
MEVETLQSTLKEVLQRIKAVIEESPPIITAAGRQHLFA